MVMMIDLLKPPVFDDKDKTLTAGFVTRGFFHIGTALEALSRGSMQGRRG